jgi:hypothetical protein
MPTIAAWRVAPVEEALHRLLSEPVSPQDLLIASCGEPVPGPGWVPMYYLTTRLHLHCSVPAGRLHHIVKQALLSMERKGEVELVTQALQSRRARFTVKRRVRWVKRLRGPQGGPPAPCCPACGRPLPDGRVEE